MRHCIHVQEDVPEKRASGLYEKTEHRSQKKSKSRKKTDPVRMKKQNDSGWLAGRSIAQFFNIGLAGGPFRPLSPCSMPESDPVPIKKNKRANVSFERNRPVSIKNKRGFGGARSVFWDIFLYSMIRRKCMMRENTFDRGPFCKPNITFTSPARSEGCSSK